MMATTDVVTPTLGALPIPDRDSGPYFSALAHGRLELQQCHDCGHWSWPPRPICSGCHGFALEWLPVRGTGSVRSWVTTYHSYVPVLAALVPYTTALVQIDEQDDIFIPGRLVGTAEVREGLRVRAVPERQTDEIGLILWAPE
jgi:uncharacterized OB-fold protein